MTTLIGLMRPALPEPQPEPQPEPADVTDLWQRASQMATGRFPGRALMARRAWSIGEDAERATELSRISRDIPVVADKLTMTCIAEALERLAQPANGTDYFNHRHATRAVALRVVLAVHPATATRARLRAATDLRTTATPYDQYGNKMVVHPTAFRLEAAAARIAQTLADLTDGGPAHLRVDDVLEVAASAPYRDYVAAHVAAAIKGRTGGAQLNAATVSALSVLAGQFDGTLGELLDVVAAVSSP